MAEKNSVMRRLVWLILFLLGIIVWSLSVNAMFTAPPQRFVRVGYDALDDTLVVPRVDTVKDNQTETCYAVYRNSVAAASLGAVPCPSKGFVLPLPLPGPTSPIKRPN